MDKVGRADSRLICFRKPNLSNTRADAQTIRTAKEKIAAAAEAEEAEEAEQEAEFGRATTI